MNGDSEHGDSEHESIADGPNGDSGQAPLRGSELDVLLYAAHASDPDIPALCRRIRDRHSRRLVPVRPWATALAAAAGLAVVAGGAWLLSAARGQGGGVHAVVGGSVRSGDALVMTVSDGEQIRTGPDSRAILELSDGSRMALAPASLAVIRGRSGGARQAVELLYGQAEFGVAHARRQFRVLTRVGSVTVLGTEFAVELLPREQAEEGGDAVNGKLAMAMAVAVAIGSVEVNVGGRSYVLSAGQSRAFAEEGGGKEARGRSFGGEVAAFDGTTLTVSRRGDSGESTETATVGAGTTILVESDETESVAGEGGKMRERRKIVPGSAADLAVGKRVRVTESAGAATQVLVLRRQDRRSEGGERDRGEPAAPQVRRPEGEGKGEGDAAPEGQKVREGGGDEGGEKAPAVPKARDGEGGREGGAQGAPKATGGESKSWW